MRRALVFVAGLLAVLAAATAGPSGAATHAVRIAQIDTSRYPLITAVVIAPGSDRLLREAAIGAIPAPLCRLPPSLD